MIRRERGNFPGLWALPGGKLEDGEGVYEAVVRELKEETGLDTTVTSYLGTAAEIIQEQEKTLSTMLFFCELSSAGLSLPDIPELQWFPLSELKHNDQVVFSDLLFLEHFFTKRDQTYMKLECIRQPDSTYLWTDQ